jgi:hypothetical protein
MVTIYGIMLNIGNLIISIIAVRDNEYPIPFNHATPFMFIGLAAKKRAAVKLMVLCPKT